VNFGLKAKFESAGLYTDFHSFQLFIDGRLELRQNHGRANMTPTRHPLDLRILIIGITLKTRALT